MDLADRREKSLHATFHPVSFSGSYAGTKKAGGNKRVRPTVDSADTQKSFAGMEGLACPRFSR